MNDANGKKLPPTEEGIEGLNDLQESNGLLCISGDIYLSHIILQEDDKSVFDRFVRGHTVKDFYVPIGTYLLEQLFTATANAGVKKKSPGYVVRGPLARNMVAPKNKGSKVDIRHFPMDTCMVKQFRLGGSMPKDATTFRILEGLGYKKGTYLENVSSLKDFYKVQNEMSDLQTGQDANYRGIKAESISKPISYVHILNLEFDHFGSEKHCSSKKQRIEAAANIDELEKALCKGITNPTFIIKVKNRSSWSGFRSHPERDVRSALCDFLLKPAVSHEPEEVNLRKSSSFRSRDAIVLVSANELRQGNVYISSHLSWERTVQSTILQLKTVERQVNEALKDCNPTSDITDVFNMFAYGFLALPRYLIVSFGCDGVLCIESEWSISQRTSEQGKDSKLPAYLNGVQKKYRQLLIQLLQMARQPINMKDL